MDTARAVATAIGEAMCDSDGVIGLNREVREDDAVDVGTDSREEGVDGLFGAGEAVVDTLKTSGGKNLRRRRRDLSSVWSGVSSEHVDLFKFDFLFALLSFSNRELTGLFSFVGVEVASNLGLVDAL